MKVCPSDASTNSRRQAFRYYTHYLLVATNGAFHPPCSFVSAGLQHRGQCAECIAPPTSTSQQREQDGTSVLNRGSASRVAGRTPSIFWPAATSLSSPASDYSEHSPDLICSGEFKTVLRVVLP